MHRHSHLLRAPSRVQLHLIRVLTVTRSTLAQAALLKASQGGKLPIVCDTSPCLSTLKASLTSPDLKCVFCLSNRRRPV